VTQADPEDGDAFVDQRLHLAHDAPQRPGIARAVAQEHPGRLVGQHCFSRGARRDHADAEAALPEAAQDVVLDAEIIGDDRDVGRAQRKTHLPRIGRGMLLGHCEVGRVLILFVPEEALPMSHLDDVVPALHRTPLAGPGHRIGIGHGLGGQETGQGAPDTQLLGQGPGVDALDSRDAILVEIGRQGLVRPPVADQRAELADHEAGAMGLPGFHVLEIDPRVADHRVGHRHDLPLVGRIGQDLLIAGHGGVEAHLPGSRSLRAKSVAAEHRTVFEGENRVHEL